MSSKDDGKGDEEKEKSGNIRRRLFGSGSATITPITTNNNNEMPRVQQSVSASSLTRDLCGHEPTCPSRSAMSLPFDEMLPSTSRAFLNPSLNIKWPQTLLTHDSLDSEKRPQLDGYLDPEEDQQYSRNLSLESDLAEMQPNWIGLPPANASISNERNVDEELCLVPRRAPEQEDHSEAEEREQRRVELDRQIERVIEQQAFNQDVIESLARANHQRVFGEFVEDDDGGDEMRKAENIENEQRPQNERARNLVASEGQPVMNEDGTLTLRGKELINNYHHFVRNFQISDQHVPRLYYGDEDTPEEEEEDGGVHVGASTSRRLLPGAFPANTSHVLAIGRKPTVSGNSSNRPANAEETNPLGWQAAKVTLKERLTFMYCNDILADVYFIVGKDENRQRIPAHRFVLSIGSVVFDAMFNGGLTPNSPSRDPLEIELPDVEPCAFLSLLRFLYSDEVSIGPDSVMTTLYTAKKYAVPALETACVDFLKKSLAADNAFMLLTQARLFDEPQLTELCLEKIDKDTVSALNAESFTEIDHDTLCLVLARDTLRVKESQLFQAVVAWAKEECQRRDESPTSENKRAIIGKALQLIRFPLMTIEEFAQTAAQSGLLTDRQMVELFMYYTVNPKPQTVFIERPRSVMGGKEYVVSRFQRTEGRWGYSGTPDKIKFTVDRKIYVVGFGLYGSIHGPYEYQVAIQIHNCGTSKVLAHNDTTFQCDGSQNTFRVSFKKPVEITPHITYIASACLKGTDSFYGTKGLRRIVHQLNHSNSVTFQFTYAAGNNNGTSVEDGQIPEIYFYRSPGK
ncbi:unnamed protein product, partial [Mesorhabditis belari]|uniref:BTB domain-containing protein n=1 Tax=Mesorhabditis belari TaxID=2138241 RepID=A0AAF3FPK1_9BILA